MSFIKGVEQIANKKVFYENALKYWDRVPPTLDGVMGGLWGGQLQSKKRQIVAFCRFLSPFLGGDKKLQGEF